MTTAGTLPRPLAPISLRALQRGEAATFWIAMPAGAHGAAYWSNLGANITIIGV